MVRVWATPKGSLSHASPFIIVLFEELSNELMIIPFKQDLTLARSIEHVRLLRVFLIYFIWVRM
jgi:hypothetical protein